jgi:hypothetical protein
LRAAKQMKRLDKAIGKDTVSRAYAALSEIAHPNWTGVNHLYSEIDRENFETTYGRGLRQLEHRALTTAANLNASLGVFTVAFDRISDVMPIWLLTRIEEEG